MRESLEFTPQLGRKREGQPEQMTEQAKEEEFDVQKRKNVYERLSYEEWLEQCSREHPIAKQSKTSNKNKANSMNSGRSAKTPQLKKGPSIGIRATIPGGPVKAAVKPPVTSRPTLLHTALQANRDKGIQQSTNGVPRTFQPYSHNPIATDWYCPICRIYLSTSARYDKVRMQPSKRSWPT